MIQEDVLSFFDINQGRRPKVILNLMTGKTTVSSLFWGLNYEMLGYINLWKQIDTVAFLQMVDRAVNSGLLRFRNERVFLTAKGQERKKSLGMPAESTGTFKFDEAMDLFLLSTQVISEFSYQNKRYIPVVEDHRINFVLKRWFKLLKENIKSTGAITESYKNNLTKIFDGLEDNGADLLANYIPNHIDSGMTVNQLAKKTNMSAFQTELKMRIIFTKVMDAVLTNRVSPLFDLLSSTSKQSALPESAMQTWELLEKGITVNQIARTRRIKDNTVKEHILMAAILIDHFPYQNFLTKKFDLPGYPTDWKIDNAQKVNSEVTFFDFRLTQIKKIKEMKNEERIR